MPKTRKPPTRPTRTPRRTGTGRQSAPTPTPTTPAPVKKRIGRPPLARPPANHPSQRPAADNLLTALGGKSSILTVLDDSAHPKASLLADRLRSPTHSAEHFSSAYAAVGLKAVDIVEIFRDVVQAKALVQAIMETPVVMESVVRAAADKLEPHAACKGTGRLSKPTKHGAAVEEECFGCDGTGRVLKSGSLDHQKLFFDVTKMTSTGPLVNIDARRSTQSLTVYGAALPGTAPNPVTVLQRADQILLAPAGTTPAIDTMSNVAEQLREMDRAEVLEAEVL